MSLFISIPWDQKEKLGSPPWSSSDPKVIAWGEAHGHDPRSKCLPEYGCLVIGAAQEVIEADLDRARAALSLAERRCEALLVECHKAETDPRRPVGHGGAYIFSASIPTDRIRAILTGGA